MRLSDWPERLAAFVAEQSRLPFEYGKTDCVCFCRGAYKAVTGEDVDLPVWTDENSANAVLSGFGGLAAAVDSRLERVEPGYARRGDIALVVVGGRECLGVVDGQVLVRAATSSRLAHVSITKAVAAWRVG